MSKTVFILGAGASYAGSSKTPLIGQFFQQAQQQGGLCRGLGKSIGKKLEERFGFNEASLLSGTPNLEDVFSMVQIDADMQDLFEGQNQKDYEKLAAEALADQLKSLIYELITTVTWDELTGPGDLYDRLVATAIPGDAFLTFNYDLQLDRALERTRKWSTSDGYGLTFEQRLTPDGNWAHPQAEPESQWQLLKLHGSLNWLRSNGVFKRNGNPTDINPDFADRHFLADCRHRWRTTLLGVVPTYRDRQNDCDLSLELKIVPPVLRKDIFDASGRPFLQTVWKKAYDAIKTADRLIIIGYSLPATDKHAEWLLRDAIRNRQGETLQVDLVNKEPKDRQRVADVFGSRLTTKEDFCDFRRFLEL